MVSVVKKFFKQAMAAFAYGITDTSSIHEIGNAFNTVANENVQLLEEVTTLRQELQTNRGARNEKKPITDRKEFERLKTFDGNEKMFGDWEFQLQQLIRPEIGFEQYLDQIKCGHVRLQQSMPAETE